MITEEHLDKVIADAEKELEQLSKNPVKLTLTTMAEFEKWSRDTLMITAMVGTLRFVKTGNTEVFKEVNP